MDQFTSNIHFLTVGKILLFIAIYVVSTAYFLPRGIQSFIEWKEKGHIKLLEKSISLCVAGVFLLVYLLIKFVTSYGI